MCVNVSVINKKLPIREVNYSFPFSTHLIEDPIRHGDGANLNMHLRKPVRARRCVPVCAASCLQYQVPSINCDVISNEEEEL